MGGEPSTAFGARRPADLLAGLNPSQREAVTTDAAPLCILAGAGSGKTRAITRRIAWRVGQETADPRHVLALTFTRRAAGELGARLAHLGVRDQVAAGTFHSLAFAQLRRRWADRGERAPAVLDRKVRLLAPMLPRRTAGANGSGNWVQPADIACEIEWAKARMVPPSRYEAEAARADRRTPLPLAAVAGLYERYEEEKRRRALVDFDDLLLACALAIETDTEFAASQRWRFRHLFVDEFQDVNPVQFRLLEAWRGGRPDLCVVGDPNQAIYAWNGADPTFLTGFPSRFPGATVVHLDDNYRSSPQVLAVANVVIGGRHRLRAHEPDGPLPTVSSFPTDREEAIAVARAVRRRHGGGRPWSDNAVLTRTHAQLVLFEEAMQAAGIPFRVRGSARFLSQPEVRAGLDQLRRLPPATPLSETVSDVVALVAEAKEAASPEDRVANLESLVRLAREHLAAEPAATVAGFLSWLVATLRSDEPHTGGDAVELATLHAAKGLEWPVVFLAGLEHGLVPIGHAESPEARAEERRLLYVGLTRARRELHCSWAEKRTFGTRTATRSPSPYLERIEATVRALADGRPPPDWREQLAVGRARLRAGGSAKAAGPQVGRNADPKVLDALKTWRAATAKASGVPAYVVFHDTTLAAVAEAKPRDRAALLALPGVGPVKVERYGEALLSLVAAAG